MRKSIHKILLSTLLILCLFSGTASAQFINGEINIPVHERGYYEPGEQVVVNFRVTDQNGNRLPLNGGDEGTLRGVWLWVAGPRQEYYLVQPYQNFWIRSNNNGFNQNAPVNVQRDEVTLTIPNDLVLTGTYTVLFNCNRNYQNNWYGLYTYGHFQVGQSEVTECESHSFMTCNRQGCHQNRSLHGTADTLNCVVCHAYDYALPWNAVMHDLRAHENAGNDDCSMCHRANGGVNNYSHNGCFTCHEYQNAADVCERAEEHECAECHDDDIYREHDEWPPSTPDEFDLLQPENDSVVQNRQTSLRWAASREHDEEDILSYEVELTRNEDFQNKQIFKMGDLRQLDVEDLEQGATYWWRVRADDINTVGTYSNQTWSFRTGTPGQTIELIEGWNMISINIRPVEQYWERDVEEGPDVVRMMEQLRIDEDNHHLRMLKNELGQFYTPAFGFSNVPYWELTDGYQVNVDEDLELTWEGEQIAPDADIPVFAGWNLVAYFPTYQLRVDSPNFYAVETILDDMIIIKNNQGQFAIPGFNFSNMEPFRPGQGYQVKMDDDAFLNYPPQRDNLFSPNQKAAKPEHWQAPSATGANMSLLILQNPELNSGGEIKAIDRLENIVGVGVMDGYGRCGLAVWGDDETTPVKDGLSEDEPYSLIYWDNDLQSEFELEPESGTDLRGQLTYKTDDLTVIDCSVRQALPGSAYMSPAFQNPFNSTTQLEYGIPEDADVRIGVYDLSGRLVETLLDAKVAGGNHNIVWDAGVNPSGVYLIRVNTGGFKQIRKVMLIR
jgi:hypothetical protein